MSIDSNEKPLRAVCANCGQNKFQFVPVYMQIEVTDSMTQKKARVMKRFFWCLACVRNSYTYDDQDIKVAINDH